MGESVLSEPFFIGLMVNLVCATLSAVLARRRGYPWGRWFVYGVLAGPVLLFFAVRLQDYRRDLERKPDA